MRHAEQLGLDLHAALQTASERRKPDQLLLARVEAGLAAWTGDHDARREWDPRIRYELTVTRDQDPQLE